MSSPSGMGSTAPSPVSELEGLPVLQGAQRDDGGTPHGGDAEDPVVS